MQPGKQARRAFSRPSCASLTANSTPWRPRSFRSSSSSFQLSPLSWRAILKPSISRYPSSLIPTTIIAVVERTAPWRRTFSRIASAKRNGYLPRGRSAQASTCWSSFSVKLLTVCRLNSRPQSSVVIFLTRRVDTPGLPSASASSPAP